MPFLDSIKIDEFIDSLNVQIPSKEKFLQLNRIFPINQKTKIKIINYERGMLLYSLIAKYKPKIVLEIGTAEGYSALCMAWAMTDYDINGRIFTIDPKPFDVPIKREITLEENPKHEVLCYQQRNYGINLQIRNGLKKLKC